MKTVTISSRSRILKDLFNLARHESVILRTSDGAEFFLTEIDDFDREVELTRQNKELIAYLEDRAKQPATISLDELKAELNLR